MAGWCGLGGRRFDLQEAERTRHAWYLVHGKSASENKFFTLADSLLELSAQPFNMLLVDRTGKIRAINQVLMIDARLFGKLVDVAQWEGVCFRRLIEGECDTAICVHRIF
jgi:hypothetical protein